jgi:hypothetical protein
MNKVSLPRKSLSALAQVRTFFMTNVQAIDLSISVADPMYHNSGEFVSSNTPSTANASSR